MKDFDLLYAYLGAGKAVLVENKLVYSEIGCLSLHCICSSTCLFAVKIKYLINKQKMCTYSHSLEVPDRLPKEMRDGLRTRFDQKLIQTVFHFFGRRSGTSRLLAVQTIGE